MIGLSLVMTFIVMIFDIKYRKIPNKVLLIFWIAGILVTTYSESLKGSLFYIVNTILGICILLIPYLLKQVGAGDVKLVAVLTGHLGLMTSINICVYFSVIGALMALFILSLKSKFPILITLNLEKSIPYAVPIHCGLVFYTIHGGIF